MSDVDLESRTATLYDTKNGEDRVIGLSSRALAILQSLIKPNRGNSDHVVCLPAARKDPVFPISTSALRSAFSTAKRRAQAAYRADCRASGSEPRGCFLTDFRLHDFRREATSRFFEEKGLDVMEVASMTGHKTLSMLRGYTALRAASLAKKLG